MKKWIILIVAVVLIGAAGFFGYKQFFAKNNSGQNAIVSTAQARKGSISVEVSGSGAVETVERETVKTKENGKIAEVKVKEGDHVKKGQVLITFEAKDNSSQIRQEELKLEQKQFDLDDARNKWKEQAKEGNETSDVNIRKLELDIQSSKDNIAALRDEAKAPAAIVSPIDGDITVLNVASGDEVNGGFSAMDIVNYDKLQTVIQVDEMDIAQIKVGQKSEIMLDALPDQKLGGAVTAIAKEGKATNGVSVFDVTIGLEASNDVKVGMSTEATVKIEQKDDILIVPIEAVHQVGNQHIVFVPATGETGGATRQNAAGEGGAAGDASGGSGTDGTNPEAGNGTPNASGAGQVERLNRMNWRNGSAANAANAGGGAMQQKAVIVEVGLHNETFIEIKSGLAEGEQVILPAVVSSTSNQTMQGGFGIGGFGGGMGVGNFNGGGRQRITTGSGSGQSDGAQGGGLR